MPASKGGGSKRGGSPPPRPTWAEWSAMGWRARQRIRAAGGIVPEPPPTIPLLLDPKQVKQLDRLARQAQVSTPEYVGFVLGRHLDRKGQARTTKHQQEATSA